MACLPPTRMIGGGGGGGFGSWELNTSPFLLLPAGFLYTIETCVCVCVCVIRLPVVAKFQCSVVDVDDWWSLF